MRTLYRGLIHLHPRGFRERFGSEMLAVFDEAGGSSSLLGDAVLSLFRQWLFRPEFHGPDEVRATNDGLMFASLEGYRIRSSALTYGGVLSVALIFTVTFLIDHPGKTPRWLIGMYRAAEGLFPISRSSLAEAKPNTLVRVPEAPVNPWKAIASGYFEHMPVLVALDADGDYVISSREMIFAPGPLRSLDRNNDGKLSVEECGGSAGRTPSALSPEVLLNARRAFMLLNPVLATLDSDHNSEISATEVNLSSITLRTLDVNHDGFITPDEFMPH